jgi:hypothetical protein
MIHFARYKVLNSAYPWRTHNRREADVPLALMPSPSRASVWMRRVPPLVKIATLLLLGLTLLSVGVVAAARSETVPRIKMPPQEYLPGGLLYRSCGDPDCDCNHYMTTGMSCVIHVNDQDVYLYYELGTNRIILMRIAAREYEIGELIIAWGFPIGFDQWGANAVVSWGERSAFLDTHSFNPYSRIQSIQYDLNPIERPHWHGWLGERSG